MRKRLYSVGVLFPKILLYKAGLEFIIRDKLLNELFQKVDIVIIARTRLQIKAAKTLVAELCRVVKWRNSLTI